MDSIDEASELIHVSLHLGLNVAFTGGLSSYGLVLLVIRFLQVCGQYWDAFDSSILNILA